MKIVTTALLVVATALAALLFMRDFSPSLKAGTDLVNWRTLSPIPLVDDQGQDTTLSASDGRLRLVFYGFVRCPDVCPATLSVLKQIYQNLPAEQQKKISIQLISVDPDFDNPKIVRQYLDKFHKDFSGLTGTKENIDKAAAEMFVGIQRPRNYGDHSNHMANQADNKASTDKTDAAALLHGDQVSIINTANQFVRVYNNQEVIRGALDKDMSLLIKKYGP